MNQNDRTLVSVVIPVFNQVHLTIRCLDSVLANSRQSLEIFVIDNASTDNTSIILNEFKQKFSQTQISFTVITNAINVGFGRAMNQGARVSTGMYVALLNNDTWVMKGWDEALVKSMDNFKADMICPYFYEGPFEADKMDSLASEFTKKNAGKKTNEWGSIMMFFRRDRFLDIGMFDEDYFVTYEDNDLKVRCDRQKYKYYLVGNCLIWHQGKGTRGKDHLPSKVEEQGFEIFFRKWGFDPRIRDNSFWTKLVRSFRKWKRKRGVL